LIGLADKDTSKTIYNIAAYCMLKSKHDHEYAIRQYLPSEQRDWEAVAERHKKETFDLFFDKDGNRRNERP